MLVDRQKLLSELFLELLPFVRRLSFSDKVSPPNVRVVCQQEGGVVNSSLLIIVGCSEVRPQVVKPFFYVRSLAVELSYRWESQFDCSSLLRYWFLIGCVWLAVGVTAIFVIRRVAR